MNLKWAQKPKEEKRYAAWYAKFWTGCALFFTFIEVAGNDHSLTPTVLICVTLASIWSAAHWTVRMVAWLLDEDRKLR